MLLIAALGIDLDRFVDAARAFGMEPLVEVHTEEELEEALKTDARIIGINNRNLNTLEVDLGTFERLAPRAKQAGVFLVAESGVHTREDALRMMQAGADALLVGTALMGEPKRLGELNRFLNLQELQPGSLSRPADGPLWPLCCFSRFHRWFLLANSSQAEPGPRTKSRLLLPDVSELYNP